MQTTNAQVSINFVLDARVEAGGWLRMTFPADYMTVSTSITNCYEDQGLLTFSSCTVDVDKNYIEFRTVDAIELSGATSTDSENF